MKNEIKYEIYIDDGSYMNTEIYDTLEKASYAFNSLEMYESKTAKLTSYELNKILVTYDEDNEIVDEEHIEVIKEFVR